MGWGERNDSRYEELAAAAAKLLQSCPTLCDPIDGRPPGSPVPGFSRQEHWSGLPFPSPPVVVHGLLLTATSLVVEHRL